MSVVMKRLIAAFIAVTMIAASCPVFATEEDAVYVEEDVQAQYADVPLSAADRIFEACAAVSDADESDEDVFSASVEAEYEEMPEQDLMDVMLPFEESPGEIDETAAPDQTAAVPGDAEVLPPELPDIFFEGTETSDAVSVTIDGPAVHIASQDETIQLNATAVNAEGEPCEVKWKMWTGYNVVSITEDGLISYTGAKTERPFGMLVSAVSGDVRADVQVAFYGTDYTLEYIDDKITVTDYNGPADVRLTDCITSTYTSMYIDAIGEDAVRNKGVKSVALPWGADVASGAFRDNPDIRYVYFQGGVGSIAEDAFDANEKMFFMGTSDELPALAEKYGAQYAGSRYDPTYQSVGMIDKEYVFLKDTTHGYILGAYGADPGDYSIGKYAVGEAYSLTLRPSITYIHPDVFAGEIPKKITVFEGSYAEAWMKEREIPCTVLKYPFEEFMIEPLSTEATAFWNNTDGYSNVKITMGYTDRNVTGTDSFTVTNLKPGSEYRYRITCENNSTTINQLEGTFKTVSTAINGISAPEGLTAGEAIKVDTNLNECFAGELTILIHDEENIYFGQNYARDKYAHRFTEYFGEAPLSLDEILADDGTVTIVPELPLDMIGEYQVDLVAFQLETDIEKAMEYSAYFSDVISVDTVPLDNIENVHVTDNVEGLAIEWDPVYDEGIAGFIIRRREAGSETPAVEFRMDGVEVCAFRDDTVETGKTYTYTVLPFGTRKGQLSVRTPVSSDEVTVEILRDTDTPEVVLAGVGENGMVREPENVIIRIEDNYCLSSVKITLSGAVEHVMEHAAAEGEKLYAVSLSELLEAAGDPDAQGMLRISAEAADINETGSETAVGTLEAEVIIDTVAPTLPTITGVEADSEIAADKMIEFVAAGQDEGSAVAAYATIGEIDLDPEKPFAAGTVFAPGVYTVKLGAADAAGNAAETSFEITVLSCAPQSIVFAENPTSIPVGETYIEDAFAVEPFYANDGTILAVSEDESILTVKVTGRGLVFNALQEGTCRVVLSAADIQAVLDVTVMGKRYNLRPGMTLDLSSEGRPVAVDNEEVVSILEDGVLYAVGEGKAVVTIEKDEGTTLAYIAVSANVAHIEACVTSLRIGVKESANAYELVEVTDAEGNVIDMEGTGLEFKSSSKKIFKVSADGKITGVKKGSAKLGVCLTATGEVLSIPVKVANAPKKVALSPRSATIAEGETIRNPFGAKFASGSYGSVTFKTLNTDLICIDEENGNITALPGSAGQTATIECRTYNKRTAKASLKILPRASAVTAPEEIVLGVGQTVEFEVTIPDGEHTSQIDAECGEKAVASVAGKKISVTGSKVGPDKLTVTAAPGVYAVVSVIVLPAPEQMALVDSTVYLGIGDTYDIDPVIDEGCAAGYTFSSNKSKVASVNGSGLIKAKAAGTATITVKTHNDLSQKIKVVVKKASKSIKIKETSVDIARGETVSPFTVTFSKGYYARYSFSSSDESIVRVDPVTGEVSGLKNGTAEVTVTALRTGAQDKCTVNVMRPAWAMDFEVPFETMGLKEKRSYKPVFPTGCAAYEVNWTSSDPGVIEISNDVLYAKKTGTSSITGTLFNGVSKTIDVTVSAAPKKITLNISEATIGVGEILPLKYGLSSGSAGKVNYSSSKKSVATVSAFGEIVGVKRGTATITAKTYNSKKDTVKLTVKSAPTSVSLPEYIPAVLNKKGKISVKLSKNSASYERNWYVFDQSGDPVYDVMTISRSGSFVAKKTGVVQVFCETYNGLYDSTVIEVFEKPKYVRLEGLSSLHTGKGKYEGYMYNKSKVQLAPYTDSGYNKFSFKSSNPSVVSVNSKGVITSKRKGTATITISSYGGIKAVLKLEVV